MAAPPVSEDIEVPRLRFDVHNPRFPGRPDSQLEAFEEMARDQKVKILALARHIAQNGLSPAQKFIVIPDDGSSYIVLDANRRLAALKALENPELMKGILTEPQMAQLRTLAATYAPPDEVACVVYERREDASAWIELMHGGQGEGEGLVEWTAQQKARHRARDGAREAHMQVLDFVLKEGKVSPNTAERSRKGKYPVSTLQRALTTPEVRDRLGIKLEAGRVTTEYPKPEVLKGLTKLVDEIGSGKVKVGDFMTRDDRAAYVKKLKAEDLPDPSTRTETATPLEDAPDKAPRKRTDSKEKKPSTARTKVIPRDVSLTISKSRINDIYHELKNKLSVRDVPNATAVLLRVFVEFSTDAYIERNGVPRKFKERHLQNRITEVCDWMQDNDIMDEKQLMPVRQTLQDPHKLTLPTNLNAYVHNPDMIPVDNELKAIWDRLDVFIRKLWA